MTAPLSCALLLLAASAWAEPAKLTVSTPRADDPRLAQTLQIVSRLFPPGFRSSFARSKDRIYVTYEADAWNPALPANEKAELLTRLKELWEAPAPAVPGAPAPAAAADPGFLQAAGDAAKAYETLASLLQTAQGQSRGYDNASRAGDEGGSAVYATPGGQKTFVFSAPRPKPKPGEPPLDNGLRGVPHAAEIVAATARARDALGVEVDPLIVRALIEAKSGFAREAKAKGRNVNLMLVDAGSAKWAGVEGDIMDPAVNIDAGTRILAKHIEFFGADQLDRALAAFQLGRKPVVEHGGIPQDAQVKLLLAGFHKALSGHARERGLPSPVVTVKPKSTPTIVARQVREKVAEAMKPAKDGIPMRKYRPQINKYAEMHGIDPDLLMALLHKENDTADRTRVSKKGAKGIAQFMPKTANWLKVDPLNDEQAIEGAARYLKILRNYDFIEARGPGRNVFAVAGYNCGEGNIEKTLVGCQERGEPLRIPNFTETVNYVTIIFDTHHRLTGKKTDYERWLPPRDGQD